jgi:hypothetical protein
MIDWNKPIEIKVWGGRDRYPTDDWVDAKVIYEHPSACKQVRYTDKDGVQQSWSATPEGVIYGLVEGTFGEVRNKPGFDMNALNEYLELREGHEPIKELYEAIMVDIWTACGKELFNDYKEWQKATRIINEIADKIKERLGVE